MQHSLNCMLFHHSPGTRRFNLCIGVWNYTCKTDSCLLTDTKNKNLWYCRQSTLNIFQSPWGECGGAFLDEPRRCNNSSWARGAPSTHTGQLYLWTGLWLTEERSDGSLTQGGRGGGVWNLVRLRQRERRSCSRASKLSESLSEFLEPTGWWSLPLNRSRGSLSHKVNRLEARRTSCSTGTSTRTEGHWEIRIEEKVCTKMGQLSSSRTTIHNKLPEGETHFGRWKSVAFKTTCEASNRTKLYQPTFSPFFSSYDNISGIFETLLHILRRLTLILHTCVGMSLWMRLGLHSLHMCEHIVLTYLYMSVPQARICKKKKKKGFMSLAASAWQQRMSEEEWRRLLMSRTVWMDSSNRDMQPEVAAHT